MSSDPRDLLHRAAQAPSTPLDATRMLRRARQLRRRRAGAGAIMLVALALPAAVALGQLPAGEVRFADPASAPDPATPPAEPAGDGCGPLPELPPAPADGEPPTPSVTLPALDEDAAAVVIDTAPEGVTLAEDAGASPMPYELVFDDPAGGVLRVGVLSEEGDGNRRAIRNGAVAPDDVATVEQWPSGVCAAVVHREDFTQIIFVAGGTVVNMMDDHTRPDPGPVLLGVDERRAWGQRIAAVLTAPPGQTDELDPGQPGSEAELVDSQGHVPGEPAGTFADIVTQEGDLPMVWERFQLEGDPPGVDWNVSALLFLGFGESGTCPARFDGVEVDGRHVRMHIGTEGGPVCTDDYRPRTFVVEVGRDRLPPEGFLLTTEREGRFVLAASPQPQPPTGPSMLRTMTAEAPQIDLVAEPLAAAAGTPVEVVLDNEDGSVAVSADGSPAVLERWEAQRWLPAAGQDGYKGHPAIAAQHQEAVPGQRATIATVDTTGLQPSWYGLRTELSVSGRGGVVEARASFNITD